MTDEAKSSMFDLSIRHVFIDVEALGPPGIGDPFALGIHAFRLDGTEASSEQISLRVPEGCTVDVDTVRWLLRQEQVVRDQLQDQGAPPSVVWDKLARAGWFGEYRSPERTILWADDWSDFAWLELTFRRAGLPSIRTLGSCYDSSPVVRLARALYPNADGCWPKFAGTQHIVINDAVHGARELCTALALLRQHDELNRFLEDT